MNSTSLHLLVDSFRSDEPIDSPPFEVLQAWVALHSYRYIPRGDWYDMADWLWINYDFTIRSPISLDEAQAIFLAFSSDQIAELYTTLPHRVIPRLIEDVKNPRNRRLLQFSQMLQSVFDRFVVISLLHFISLPSNTETVQALIDECYCSDGG